MTLFGGLFERRGLNDPTVPLTNTSLVDWLSGQANDSGVRVTEKTAFSNPAVFRAIALLTGTCASLPLLTYTRGTRDPVAVPLLDEPNPAMTSYEFWELVYLHRYTFGNSYSLKVRDGANRVRELWPLPPGSTKAFAVAKSDANPAGRLFEVAKVGGGTDVLSPNEVMHIKGLSLDGVTGMSPIRLHAQGIGMSMAAEKYGAKLFSSGQLMAGILQSDARIDETKADELAARWRAKVSGLQRAHDIVVLGSGAKFQPIAMPNTDAQFLESRKFQVIEVARMFGIPPHLLMDVERSTSWGTGIEQQQIGLVNFTLKADLTRAEQRVTREVTPAGVEAKYKIRDLQRGDAAARSLYYQMMRNTGAFSANDILGEEDLPGIGAAGDTRLEPMNMQAVGSSAAGDTSKGAGDAADQ